MPCLMHSVQVVWACWWLFAWQVTQLAPLHAAPGEVWGRVNRPRVQSSPGQAAAGCPSKGGCKHGVVLAGS